MKTTHTTTRRASRLPYLLRRYQRIAHQCISNAVAFLLTCIVLTPVHAGINYQQKADELMPVDCLLPGAIRKLGGQMTYITQRRPIKTTGVDCEIRGGEYVLYDRASYESALAIWKPMAESGDPKAQNFVGEIFEKGLGVAPNYALAADWYRKAAEQNYNAAQINLGQLYERGLGVEHNMEQALAWYRKSANIKGKTLKFVRFDYSDEKIAAMEQQLNDNEKQAQLQKQRIQYLAKQLDTATSEKKTVELQLAAAKQQFEAERKTLEGEREQLAAYQRESEKLRSELKQQLAAQQAQQAQQPSASENGLKLPKIVIQFDKKKLAKLKKELRKSEAEMNTLAEQLAKKEASLAEQQLALKQRDLKLAEISAEYQKVQRDLNNSQQQLGKSVSSSIPPNAQLAMNTAPIIEIIEPPIHLTRGNDVVIQTRSGADQRTIVGQVKSANPILEVLVNDKAVKVDSKGLFQHRIPLTRSLTDVSVVAIDTNGLRASTEFKLALDEEPQQNLYAGSASKGGKKPIANIPKVNFGSYHALVIGNSEYQTLPDLNTTIADADAMEEILTTRYGFKVTKLIDATRYDILSALNNLRSTLTENDNLLIYYAGHGELDEVNNRGHWLPIDAEESSTANWISNIAITDILNAMSVRKVLVVADSCYSGAMTRSTLARLDAGRSEKAWENWLKLVSEQRSRLSFSSGGLAPVLDGGGGKHSIFAKALLDVLESNNTVIEGRELHTQVAQAVSYAASAAQFEQAPQYAPIRFAGHESGDFLFVPRPN